MIAQPPAENNRHAYDVSPRRRVYASTDELYYNPKHPYTEALLNAIPKPDPRRRHRPMKLPGDVPSPANPPSGCYFHPRCQYAQDVCKQDRPPLRDVGNEHWVACHFAEELKLQGVTRLNELPLIELPKRQAPATPPAAAE